MVAAVSILSAQQGGALIDRSALNTLLPMHVLLNGQGVIIHAGPTFSKLFAGDVKLIGTDVLALVGFDYPKGITQFNDLKSALSTPLSARLKHHTGLKLKAVAVDLSQEQGLLVNFSFGTSLREAVTTWRLTGKDFSPADPSEEMLYVIEVQSALLKESRNLNSRLFGQREEAEEQAFTDPLTGLSNRRALERFVTRLMRKRDRKDFAVVLLDLDHFKAVNDTLGHAAGDKVLVDVAEILLAETRANDMVVRTGGDEFVLVIDGFEDYPQISEFAQRIIQKIERPIQWGGKTCYVGASIGISISHSAADKTLDTHLQQADDALYVSKNNGRGTFRLAGDT